MKKIKVFILNNYSFVIIGLFVLVIVVFGIIKQDNIIVTVNDNMDSNISIYKMIRDNHLFGKNNGSIPFLGGVVNTSQFRSELNLSGWLYYFLSPLVAYYSFFILRILLSSLGFYFLAKKLKDYNEINVDKNLWCICGFLYGLLGTWPQAALGFAALPWFTLITYVFIKTGKKRYIPLFLFPMFLTSFVLIGIFVIFYVFVFFFVISIAKKKIYIPLLICFFGLIVIAGIMNYHYFFYYFPNSYIDKSFIKQIKPVIYNETIFQSLALFPRSLLGSTFYYHAGGACLKYTVIPFILIYALYCALDCIKNRKINKREFLFFILICCCLFNTFLTCFDKNYFFRTYLFPFANNFSFYRISWLSPFFMFVCLAIALEHHGWDLIRKIILIVFILLSFDPRNEINKNFTYLFCFFTIVILTIENKISLKGIILILVFIAITFDPRYQQRNSMYNELYWNNCFAKHKIDINHEWTWREFYSENLFNEIKEGINYDGSWSIAFGIEPSVLQYNGIKTLDGYYSNYSKEYHDTFERLIGPLLNIDRNHRTYWEKSGGIRAYVYSLFYAFIPPKHFSIKETGLYIDSNVFKEMNGKYIFSRFKISNWEKLGIVQIGRTYSSPDSPYKIYVYMLIDNTRR